MPDTPRRPIICIRTTPPSTSVPTVVVPRKAAVTMKQGDVVEVLRDLDTNTFDGAPTDPPYGLTSIVKRFGKKNSKPPKMDGPFGRTARGFMGHNKGKKLQNEKTEVHKGV